MKIYVDADACPVIGAIEKVAQKFHLAVLLVCDTNHMLSSDYCEIKVVDAGVDAVDFALVTMCQKEDIVVTQDYGVAAMALGKGAVSIHPSGKWYTDKNMDQMLLERHISKKVRRSSSKNHLKGKKRRSKEDDLTFCESLDKLVQHCLSKGE